MSFLMPKAPDIQLPAMPKAPALPPMFGTQPAQKKPAVKPMAPSFLGTEMTATTSQKGQKTLLGM